jgi:putative acetyltransferase
VRLAGAAVGCGAIGFDEGFAELKRMYVRPKMRGLGAVQALLQRLEEEAAARGVALLRLETGDTLHAAHKVYERAGFKRCGAFGHYLTLEPHRIARSVFMEKKIG